MMFFKDDCDSYIWGEPDVNDEPARTCGEEGPAIALATVLWMFVTCILFTVVYCSVKKQNTIKDLNEMQPEPVAEETETNRKQKLKKKLDKV